MSDVVIRLENLGKRYRIGGQEERYRTIREAIVEGLTAPVSLLRRYGENLRSSPGWIWALEGVSLEVKRGEVLGIIGRNGAGKTTLLKIVSRVTKPTEGSGEIHGRLGSLLEVGTGFHPELTGRENIYLNGAILGMRKADIDRRFDEIVAFAEVERFVDTPVKRYSSGMHMRLAFAVAAHLKPDILLVDEVLAVGDAAFQEKCLGKMGSVARAGRTVLFVSHNMAAVSNLCSRACLLHHGKLITTGPVGSAIEEYMAHRTPPSTSLRERKDRTGDGRMRFTQFQIQDGTGAPVANVASGQDVGILLAYEGSDDRQLRNVSVTIGFYGVFGQFWVFCGNEMTGTRFESLPPQGRLLCSIPRLPLAPGRYDLNLHCEVNGIQADWLRQACQLDVTEGDFFGTGRLPPPGHGGVLVPHSWSFVEKA